MIARAAIAAGVLAASLAGPAPAMDELTFHMIALEADWSDADEGDRITWDGESWFGGDRNRVWFKTEGEALDGDVEAAEIEAFYGRNVARFWDVLLGARVDLEPDGVGYLAAGVQGLAPYQFETEAFAYVSEEGDVSFRAEQAIDLLITQRLVLEPIVEIEAFAQDVPEREAGAGFSDVEAALRLRYEISRKFAPYVETRWERALGETAIRARGRGDEVEETSFRIGARGWF